MAQYVHKRFSTEEQNKLLEEICGVLQDLGTVKEKEYFLKDLLSRGERVMIARRFKIAKLLEEGLTYSEIAELLGVGDGTIARVEKMLNFGRNGYRIALKKIKNRPKKQVTQKF